jgi:hypothetical protein
LAKAQIRFNKQSPAKAGGNSTITQVNFNAAKFLITTGFSQWMVGRGYFFDFSQIALIASLYFF